MITIESILLILTIVLFIGMFQETKSVTGRFTHTQNEASYFPIVLISDSLENETEVLLRIDSVDLSEFNEGTISYKQLLTSNELLTISDKATGEFLSFESHFKSEQTAIIQVFVFILLLLIFQISFFEKLMNIGIKIMERDIQKQIEKKAE